MFVLADVQKRLIELERERSGKELKKYSLRISLTIGETKFGVYRMISCLFVASFEMHTQEQV